MVIHIFKNGATTTELKDVYVPKEIVQSIYTAVREEPERKKDETNNLLG